MTSPIAILLQDARTTGPASSGPVTLALIALSVLVAGALVLIVTVMAMAVRRGASRPLNRTLSGRDAGAHAQRGEGARGTQVADAWTESARRMPTPGPGDEDEGSP